MTQAVFFIRGNILLKLKPPNSELKSCTALPESCGKRTIKIMMTPNPPSHWVRLRQSRILLGTISTSGITDAPVVVSPETLSKSAETTSKEPEKRYGRLPTAESSSQAKTMVATPSRLEIVSLYLS